MSQTELANELGVAQPTVHKWETGQAMPSADRLPGIADVLQVSVDDLLGRSEVVISSATTDLEELRQRDPDQYEAIVTLLRGAVERARREK